MMHIILDKDKLIQLMLDYTYKEKKKNEVQLQTRVQKGMIIAFSYVL